MSAPSRYYTLPHYSNAGWFIPLALHDLLDLLLRLPAINRQVGTAMSVWFEEHHHELKQGRYPHTDAHWAELDRLDQPMIDAEHRLEYAATSAIFMAAVDLEARINREIEALFGVPVAESLDALSYARKFEATFALKQLPFRDTHIHEAVKDLATWRNAFAHGKATTRPKSLRQRMPPSTSPDYPTPQETVGETVHLLRRYLLVVKHLGTLDATLAVSPAEQDEYQVIANLLSQVESIEFDPRGQPS